MRARLKLIRGRTSRILRQVLTPISQDKLRSALNRLVGTPRSYLLVHSALASCGRFTSGPGGVLHVLREYCGTLCLPTYTYCYPDPVGGAGPLFDPHSTPSQMGLLTETFRKERDATRSIHATHSLAMSGPFAKDICADHYRQDAPCGVPSPFGRLVQRQASVLMFGVSFHSYTFYHTAEDASGGDYAYEKGAWDRLRVIDENGQQRDCSSRRQTRDPRRFAECGDLLERAGLARRVTLGRGTLLFVPDCSKVHDFLVERLRQTPDFLYQSCARSLS